MLVRVQISEYYFLQPRYLNACCQYSSEMNCVGSSPNIGIYLSAAQIVERVLPVAFGNKLCVTIPNIGVYLSAAQIVERVLPVAFGNKLCV